MTHLSGTFQCLILKVAMLNLNVCILFFIFKVIVLLVIYLLLLFIMFFLSECISLSCVRVIPTWADRRRWFPGAGDRNSSEPPYGFWKLNLGLV